MEIVLAPAMPAHVDELGRICYEAFKDVSETHGFIPDFPSVEVARHAIGMMVSQPHGYGVCAMVDANIAGSNFLWFPDDVAGVGPITVDVAFQGLDLGQLLMRDVLQYAQAHDLPRVRLVQDAFNTRSISLYARLGFDTRHPLAVMRPAPSTLPDHSIRDATPNDLGAIEGLCTRIYKISRRREVEAAMQHELPVLVRERNGQICAYLIPRFFGHGVGESPADLVALAQEGARRAPDQAQVFCPLDQAEQFRAFLAAGFRTVELMNLMTMGPYDPPSGVWVPSVMY